MYIDELDYVKKCKKNFLKLYVEKEDMSSIDLDSIVLLSDEISKKLDEVNLMEENYTLDVSTSGAEKEIKDFKKFPLLINRYLKIKVDKPIKGENIIYGDLKAVKENSIILTYKVKTRIVEVEIEFDNILKAYLAVRI